MKPHARILVGAVVGAALFAGAVGWWISDLLLASRAPVYADAAASGAAGGPAARIGGPFALTDHTGARVTEASYAGKVRLMFFGFTHCPDVCPTALATVAEAMALLGPDAAQVQPLFVSVDPRRDAPELLARYVASFDPRIVGLTGSDQEIAETARRFRVFYRRSPGSSQAPDAQDYTIDHSTILYVMGRDGAYRRHLDHMASPQDVAAAARAALAG